MDNVQRDAVGRATALVEEMPAGVARQQSATFIAYRLMMRGACPQALRVLNRELTRVADPTALGGLATGALTGRDARCMAWVAARIDAVLQGHSLNEAQRAELRLRGRTLFALVGQTTRAAGMPRANQTALEIVPDSLGSREFTVGGTSVIVGLSDAPTRLETLLLDRLWEYRRTPLQLALAQALAARAAGEPHFLSPSGWVEVALTLLAAGERDAAQQVLATAGVRFMSLAGLEAELALRRRDAEGAAALVAANDWGTKGKSVYRLIESRPDVLIPFIEGNRVFDGGTSAGLDLMALSAALDRTGHPAEAERAARAALTRFGENDPIQSSPARALARVGNVGAARSLLARALDQPGWEHPEHLRNGIVGGAALAGNLAEVERAIADAPEARRAMLLVSALAAVARTASPLRETLEDQLEARFDGTGGFDVSAETLVLFAQAGVRTRLLVALVRRLERGRQGAAAAIRFANAARQQGPRESAVAGAEAAETLLPEGPQADAELVGLAEFYWRLRLPQKAVALVRRISHPVGRVDAMTRALNPQHVEPRPRLSFVTF